MDPVIEKLLNDIIVFVNKVREDIRSENIGEYIKILEDDYVCLEQKKIDYFEILDAIFEKDTPMYLLVISVLFFISQDGKMLCKAEMLLEKGNLPYDLLAGIYLQLGVNRFLNSSLDVSYEQKRKMHRIVLQQFEKFFGEELAPLPYEERNHKRIVVSTDALLDDLHAPTYLVLDICRVLQEEMGYEVLLLVNVNKVNMELVSSYWVFPYETNYAERYHGNFVREFRGCLIKGYQMLVEEKTIPQVRQMMRELREWKPEFIWHIGGGAIVPDVIGKITTWISMPCTEGYAVSEAPILVSYMLENKPEAVLRQNYIDRMGQRTINIKLEARCESEGKEYGPKDFGIPEDGFMIAIVGKRLSIEIDSIFIQIMEEIARREEKVYYLLIGFSNQEWNQEALKGRVIKLGFRKDLDDVLRAAHLFLNPIRKGGGGGAFYAISNDVPVITLPDCDVATCVGEAFICDSLERFPDLVSRYCHDPLFYEQKVKECQKQSREINRGDNVAACKTVVQTVQRWISECVEEKGC